MAVVSILKGHELLKNLSVGDVDRISTFSERRHYKKGETIFKAGDDACCVYVLLNGSVLLRLPSEAEEIRLAVSRIEKGELFGLSPLLGSETYTTEARVTEDTEVLAIDAEKFRDLLQSDCTAGFHIMSEVANAYFTRYIDLLGRLQGIVPQLGLIPTA